MAEENGGVMDLNLDDIDPEDGGDDGIVGDDDSDKDPTAELQAKIDALTKEKDGIYKEMISERRTRQELKSQVDNIAGLIEELKAKKQGDVPLGTPTGMPTVKGIPVKFDDEGNPFIDPQDLSPVVEPKLQEVKEDLSHIKGKTQIQALEAENAKIIESVIQSDPSFTTGYQKVQQAWAFLDKGLDKIIASKGINPAQLTLDTAVELLEDSDVADEFAAQFPGLDIDMVVDANTRNANGVVNKRKLKKAVKAAVKSSADGTEKLNKLKLIASKPNNLTGQANRKGSGGRTLNDIADIGVDDLLNLSDADIARLERALGAADA